MPLTRSRPRTESKFVDAVVAHLSEKGCDELGINAIAKRAGADKVLIYRYFKDLDGLLEQAAREIEWLPEPASLLVDARREPLQALREVLATLRQSLAEKPASKALLRWRKAVNNPLTTRFNADWNQFWQELTSGLAEGQGYDARKAWQTAASIAALLLEAEIGGESFNHAALECAVTGLQATAATPPQNTADAETPVDPPDALPTNLL
ncbi:MAG: TetR family transcriptional regulator [Verrucomicrobia bacterium]|nr:TetR family transcriptional regulator [Verrucomicrobiota bacterium]